MKRNPKIVGQVVDVERYLWDIRQIRDTKHGFDLLFRSPSRPESTGWSSSPDPLADFRQAD